MTKLSRGMQIRHVDLNCGLSVSIVGATSPAASAAAIELQHAAQAAMLTLIAAFGEVWKQLYQHFDACMCTGIMNSSNIHLDL